jgi:phosphonate transport system permease protein
VNGVPPKTHSRPALIAALSVVPGLGQLVAGQRARGLWLLLGLPAQAALLAAADVPRVATWLVLVWLWNLRDAYATARGRSAPLALPIAILLFINAAAGWSITEIQPLTMLRGLPRMRPILAGLAQPDLAERARETQTGSAILIIGRAREGLPASRSARGVSGSAASPHVRLTPSSVPPAGSTPGGARVTVTGTGFWPSTPGRMWLVGEGRVVVARIVTDAAGRVEAAVTLPERPPGRYWVDVVVDRPLRRWQASEALTRSAGAMVATIFMALMGTLFAVVLALPLSFFGARNLMAASPATRALYGATRTVMNVLRSVEVMIVALLMVVVVGTGPFAGVLALAIHGVGALGKLYSEAIEAIDPGPIEAVRATGATPLQVVMFGVVPQVTPQIVAFTVYRWDINVRMATVIGLVGGGGIGFLLQDAINLGRWSQAGTAIWLIALVVSAMDAASAALRDRLL